MLRKHKQKVLVLGIISMVLIYWIYNNVHLTLVSYLEKQGVGEKIQVITQQEIGTDTWLIIFTQRDDSDNCIYMSVYEKDFLSFQQLGYGSMINPGAEQKAANGRQGIYHCNTFRSSIGQQWIYWGIIFDDTVKKAVHCGSEMNFIPGNPPIPSICWYVGEGDMANSKVEPPPVLS